MTRQITALALPRQSDIDAGFYSSFGFRHLFVIQSASRAR